MDIYRDILEFAKAATVTALLVAWVVAGWAGLYVWRWVHDAVVKDLRDAKAEWRDVALYGSRVAGRAVDSVREAKP